MTINIKELEETAVAFHDWVLMGREVCCPIPDNDGLFYHEAALSSVLAGV